MLRPVQRISRPGPSLSRWLHASFVGNNPILKDRPSPEQSLAKRPKLTVYEYTQDERKPKSGEKVEKQRHAKRNEVGVQMLSRSLHKQVFKNCAFPKASQRFKNISLEHLKTHDLDPTQSSTHPSTEFTLPPLQGNNLLEHFHTIGIEASEPHASLAKSFAETVLPPLPEHWDIQAGWTKYHHLTDGSSYSEHVSYPENNGASEQLLTFDVETMPKLHPWPIMACAASPNGWYCWISPWLLGETEDPNHPIPLGPPDVPRVVVGHNVSYDRARVKEEYHLGGTENRFLDTMSLHIAIKGISSHQRPAWIKHRKNKDAELERRAEAAEAVVQLMNEVRTKLEGTPDPAQGENLRTLLVNLEASLPSLQASLLASDDMERDTGVSSPNLDEDEAIEASQKRWEDITSANSLVDVAKLHCDIDISKEIRGDFMTATRDDILANITDYLNYCASDVVVTHSIFRKVLPEFLIRCPHPVSFAGILAMGSGFLPVNEAWEKYLEKAEGVYRTLESQVKADLASLARAAMEKYQGNSQEDIDDVWLSQLDWTPKVAGKSRGIVVQSEIEELVVESSVQNAETSVVPQWYADIVADPFSKRCLDRVIPRLLKLSFESIPLQYSTSEGWYYRTPLGEKAQFSLLANKKMHTILTPRVLARFVNVDTPVLSSSNPTLFERLAAGNRNDSVREDLLRVALEILEQGASETYTSDPWLSQLDWKPSAGATTQSSPRKAKKPKFVKAPPVYWPKWFWELTKPKKDMAPGTMDITIRNRFAPLLLKMSWHDQPLFHSREHGWIFRVPAATLEDPAMADRFSRLKPLSFYDAADEKLADDTLHGGYSFYKLPHKDGDKANVGSPLGKTFMTFALDGVLKSGAGDAANKIVDVNVQCSYWVSARDRILNQLVGWEDLSPGWKMGFPPVQDAASGEKWGIILPQLITMGTVTRRAIEKTWLTASNAKKNRVGSELKAMVRAPPGYAIVGADVDSEELWISSCMGDAQFGFHGATAIGWMTLEGTKAAGTDLHSKTAKILETSRDQAKVFNYSRIYGAGMRHAVLLLLQGNSRMAQEEAQKLAANLYASTKGKNTHRSDFFGRKFWFGGTESYLFNKLEEIAISSAPETPALGCGVTSALSKQHLPQEFGADYMPSRINWVVQSSGVDYLHLLIASMDHLIKRYQIKARYLISVHDELRYLVEEQDKYRLALAMQIANLWTRSMFAYKLGMDDLPQGVAFFSAVDVDHVLRKEVDMPCVTPSQPTPIPSGESFDITQILAKTNGGSLLPDGSTMPRPSDQQGMPNLEGFVIPDCLSHRAKSPAFLQAQATSDLGEIRHLAKTTGRGGNVGADGGKASSIKKKMLGDGANFDWSSTVERLLQSGRDLDVW